MMFNSSDVILNICKGNYMREANNINDASVNKKYVERIKESLIKKNVNDNNNEEIEFLLKRL